MLTIKAGQLTTPTRTSKWFEGEVSLETVVDTIIELNSLPQWAEYGLGESGDRGVIDVRKGNSLVRAYFVDESETVGDAVARVEILPDCNLPSERMDGMMSVDSLLAVVRDLNSGLAVHHAVSGRIVPFPDEIE